MRFLVLGAGSQGSYFGGMLLQGGADVSFLVRPERAAELAERGLVIKLPDGEIRQRVRALLAGEIDGRYDVVLLACKTYDLGSAIEAVAPALGERSAILPIQNGINHIEVLVDRFSRDRVLGGLSNVAAARSPDGEVIWLPGTAGTLIFGELTGAHTTRCDEIELTFAAGGVPGRISEHIIAEMWLKLCDGHNGERIFATGCNERRHPRALRAARLNLFPFDPARPRTGTPDRSRPYHWRTRALRRPTGDRGAAAARRTVPTANPRAAPAGASRLVSPGR